VDSRRSTEVLPAILVAPARNSVVLESLDDYVYAAATNDFGVAVWNDVRNASDCRTSTLEGQPFR